MNIQTIMKTLNLKILIVEDDSLTLATNRRILREYGTVSTATNAKEAINHLNSGLISVAFIDLNLHGELKGLEIIKYAAEKKVWPIVVSGEDDPAILKKALSNGAKDFLLKPFTIEKLEQALKTLKNNLDRSNHEEIIRKQFITQSAKQIAELLKLGKIASSDKPIFVKGPTGSGKRVVSNICKELHKNNKFVEVNCSQFNDELLASELFGHKKGAFTGANENKIGLLETANNGIIFFDEVATMSMSMQQKILKALEEKTFHPVGSTQPVHSNFRAIFATCEDIESLIKAGKFREDLYARAATFQINILPLKERKEDILLQLEHFISKNLIRIFIEDEAKEALLNYDWPRNTREIQDLIENWITDGDRIITLEQLPPKMKVSRSEKEIIQFINESHLEIIEQHGLNSFLTFIKKEATLSMIKKHNGILKSAADVMNVSYPSLCAFLKNNKSNQLISGRIS